MNVAARPRRLVKLPVVMRRLVCGLLSVAVAAVLWTPAAFAHIVHAGNAFADIALSEYKDEIVYVAKLGLIVGEEAGGVFRPSDPLLLADLAYWAAVFHGLPGAGAGDAEAAGQAALAAGLVGSLEGQATYGDINRAVFRGALTLGGAGNSGNTGGADNAGAAGRDAAATAYPAGQAVTREQYAAFVAAFASESVDGKRLEEHAGFAAGPRGVVQAKAAADARFGYRLVIAGRTWTLSPHPRVVGAPGDPALWDGAEMAASWISYDDQGAAMLELLDFRVAADAEHVESSEAAGSPENAETSGSPASSEAAGSPASSNNPGTSEQSRGGADSEDGAASAAAGAPSSSRHDHQPSAQHAAAAHDEAAGRTNRAPPAWLTVSAVILVAGGAGVAVALSRRRKA